MADTQMTPPQQLGFLGRVGKGIFIKPTDSQIFETNLDDYKESSMEDPYNTKKKHWFGYDSERFSKIKEIEKKIANAINNYLKSYSKTSPITFKNDNISGMDEPFVKALKSITITKPNMSKTLYQDEELQQLKTKIVHLNENTPISWHSLTRDISHKTGGFVGPNRAKLTFELDMSRLVQSTSDGGRRRSSRNIVRKMSKRNSRAKSRNYRSRK